MIAYHGDIIGVISKAEVADRYAKSKNEEHQRPEVTLGFQLGSGESEYFNQACKNPAL